MRLLILSFYYPPDLGPGALRARSIVDALIDDSAQTTDPCFCIDVLTTKPNRYHSFSLNSIQKETSGNVRIHRYSMPMHRSGMLDQSFAFLFYAYAVWKKVKRKEYDIVIATSSRLATATLGAYAANKCKAKLYLDIRDLFTDTIKDVYRNSPIVAMMPAFKWLERWTFNQADRINVVSPGFILHVLAVNPSIEPRVFTNGIDKEFILRNRSANTGNHSYTVVYAGNLGHGQGLHLILPLVAKKFEGLVTFRVFGDGGQRSALLSKLIEIGVVNVEILNPISRTDLIFEYSQADILFVHLNDHAAFRNVLPSKVFEYGATGKPILAGLSGHAAEFTRAYVNGAEVFRPCNAVEMEAKLRILLAGPKYFDRSAFCEQFDRTEIMRKMADDIVDLGFERRKSR